jgi:hypothetical protein
MYLPCVSSNANSSAAPCLILFEIACELAIELSLLPQELLEDLLAAPRGSFMFKMSGNPSIGRDSQNILFTQKLYRRAS